MAVNTQGSLWPPQEACYFRRVLGAGPHVERSELKRGFLARVAVTVTVTVGIGLPFTELVEPVLVL